MTNNNQPKEHGPMTIQDLMLWTPPKLQSLVGGPSTQLLVSQGKMVIYGRWGSWKSMLSMNLAFKACYGQPWIGFPTQRCKVLILQIEITPSKMKDRIAKFLKSSNITNYPTNISIWSVSFYKIDRDTKWLLDSYLSVLKPDILIIDPIYKVISGNINDPMDVNRLLDRCDELISRHNLAIVLIGHIRKPKPAEDGSAILVPDLEHELIGSSFYMDWADTLASLYVKVRAPDKEIIHVKFEKTRHAEDSIPELDVSISRSTLQMQVVGSYDASEGNEPV